MNKVMSRYSKCSFEADSINSSSCSKDQIDKLSNKSGLTTEDLSSSNILSCTVKHAKTYKNCVIETDNPWLTVNYNNDTCSLPEKISVPHGFEYNEANKEYIKPDSFPSVFKQSELCHEKWYDWFSIPDYFHGNKYYYDEKIQKCFSPCEIGFVPQSETQQKCIMKSQLNMGIYKNELYYTPLQLVLLLGHNKTTLLKQHINEIKKYNEKIKSSISFEIDINILNNDGNIHDKYSKNILNDMIKDLSKRIKEIVNIIEPDNIIEPNNKTNDISDFINTKEHIEQAYDIAKMVLTYQNNNSEESKKYTSNNEAHGIFYIADYKNVNKDIENNHYQLLLRACDVCFNGKSHYSSNILFYRMNDKIISSKDKKQPLSFKKDSKPLPTLKYSDYMNKDEYARLRITNTELNKPYTYSPSSIFDTNIISIPAKTFFKILIILFIFIFFMIILTLIMQGLWEPFSKLFNKTVGALLGLFDYLSIWESDDIKTLMQKKAMLSRKYDFLDKTYKSHS